MRSRPARFTIRLPPLRLCFPPGPLVARLGARKAGCSEFRELVNVHQQMEMHRNDDLLRGLRLFVNDEIIITWSWHHPRADGVDTDFAFLQINPSAACERPHGRFGCAVDTESRRALDGGDRRAEDDRGIARHHW